MAFVTASSCMLSSRPYIAKFLAGKSFKTTRNIFVINFNPSTIRIIHTQAILKQRPPFQVSGSNKAELKLPPSLGEGVVVPSSHEFTKSNSNFIGRIASLGLLILLTIFSRFAASSMSLGNILKAERRKSKICWCYTSLKYKWLSIISNTH